MKPFEEAVQEIPADKAVWYELPAQAVEMKTAVVGMVVPATAALAFFIQLFSLSVKAELE